MRILNINCTRLHIELTNRCALKCPRCERTGKEMELQQLELSTLKKVFEHPEGPDPLKTILTLSGTLGDCLYHSHLHEIINYLKDKKFTLQIESNGSYRQLSWWKELGVLLTKDDQFTFSLDGIGEELYRYRVGADWKSILEGIKSLKENSACKLVWKFIVFSHNQHQIDEARKMASDLGFAEFKLIKSSRFLKNDPLLPSPQFHPVRLDNKRSLQKLQSFRYQLLRGLGMESYTPHIEPDCLSGEGIFLSYDGYLLPCPVVNKKPWFQDRQDSLSLHTYNLSEVLSSPVWGELSGVWKDYYCSPSSCQKRCGRVKKYTQHPFSDEEVIYTLS